MRLRTQACAGTTTQPVGVRPAHADPALAGFNTLRHDTRNQKQSYARELSRRLRRTVDTELDLAL